MENWSTFLAGLREDGYVEGKNFVFEHRDARGGHAVRAARDATNTIPIVAIDLETDPIVAHFVQSLPRPGGNVTGMFLDLADLSGKHMEFLKEMIPRLSRMVVVGDPEINISQLRATEVAGRVLSIKVQTIEIRRSDDFGGACQFAVRNNVGALLFLSSPLVLAHRRQIADLAVRHRLPAMFVYRSHVDAVGLLSYGPNLPDMFYHCGVYVARILGGRKPAEMPVERPMVFELVINRKTAKVLGLTIPQSLLLRADQVLE